ncbi:MAG TPA: SRPBCC domain-containing protein [Thermoplasmata archaeon]|nr:SRPBCC domain-containing protein [Thermoplasmata archaeon]
MLELRTEIEIDAPVERVWAVLIDFERFPDWNPFIRRIHGNAQVGSRLDVLLGASGTRPMRFRPTVKAVVPNRELRWLGRLGLPRLFDGEHIFQIEPLGPNRVRFVQRERFRGLLVPLLARSLNRDVRRGFEEMNRALRERVTVSAERRPAAGKA